MFRQLGAGGLRGRVHTPVGSVCTAHFILCTGWTGQHRFDTECTSQSEIMMQSAPDMEIVKKFTQIEFLKANPKNGAFQYTPDCDKTLKIKNNLKLHLLPW